METQQSQGARKTQKVVFGSRRICLLARAQTSSFPGRLRFIL